MPRRPPAGRGPRRPRGAPAPPRGGDGARSRLADAQPRGEMVQLDAVHLRGEYQARRVKARAVTATAVTAIAVTAIAVTATAVTAITVTATAFMARAVRTGGVAASRAARSTGSGCPFCRDHTIITSRRRPDATRIRRGHERGVLVSAMAVRHNMRRKA